MEVSTYRTRLFKRGRTTLAVTLPAALIRELELSNGMAMDLVVDTEDRNRIGLRRANNGKVEATEANAKNGPA